MARPRSATKGSSKSSAATPRMSYSRKTRGFGADRLEDRRQLGEVGADRRQQARRAEEEHPGVPQVVARGEVALGGGLVGLLDEPFDPAGAERVAASGRELDVAEAGVGPG